jgi:hypothetical protein
MHVAAIHGLFTDVELIDRPEVRLIDDLVAYWERKRAGRTGPRRADIDPAEIKIHLPYVFMLDVLDGGADFRFRLIGTRIVDVLGRNSTGRRVSELFSDEPGAPGQLQALFKLVVDRNAPVFARGRIFWAPEARYRRFAGAGLPLSEDGVIVSIILGELFIEHGGRLEAPRHAI